MTNSLYRPLSKGLAGAKIPLSSDVAQLIDLFNGNADVGILSLAGQIATLSTGGLSLALASGGTLGIGVYRYKFTHVTGLIQADGTPIVNGETPGSTTLSITTTSGNQKVTISGLPAVGAWPSSAIGIRIYRTAVGGADATQKLVTTLFTNYLETTFVTSYLDGIADSSLTTAVPTTNTTGTTLAPLVTHAADYTEHVPYGGVTTGSANTYVLAAPTITALTVGMAVSVKFNVDCTAASTLNWNGTGAKGIKKANGTDVTNLHATGIYTLRYDGTNFILQGEGSDGTALAGDILAGKTATVLNGDITGTMPNKSGTFDPPTSLLSYAGGMDAQAAAGYYDGATKLHLVEANFLATNIPNGMSMFGLVGTGAASKRFASGSGGFTLNGTTTISGTAYSYYWLNITGLAFTPSRIIVIQNGDFGCINYVVAMPTGTHAFGNMFNPNRTQFQSNAQTTSNFFVSGGLANNTFQVYLDLTTYTSACTWYVYE